MSPDSADRAIEPEVLPPEGDLRAERMERLRRWSRVLDEVFRVPGTNVRFGIDPILGLIPGLGDLTTPIFSALLILQGMQLRVPRVVQLRMLLNVAIDAVTGFVPFLGDLFDVGWKANMKNVALLERYARPDAKPQPGDWIFVLAALAILALCALVPIAIVVWLLTQVPLV